MFKNYLKIAFRNIKRQKVYSFINIAGLAIGMVCCILILLWVQDELSYDRFHKNGDDIYRVIKIWRKGEISHQARTPAPLAPALKEEIPEIIQSARFLPARTRLVKYGESMFHENRGILADPAIIDMFTIPLVKGDPKTALSNPTSIVLTEALAAKYFGDEEPLGKILRMDNQFDFSVTGVMKNISMNSHLQFDFVVPFTLIGEESLMDWHNTIYYSYVLLEKNTSYQEVSQKISNYLKKPIQESTSSLYLQPLKRIHLYSSYLRGRVAGSSDINFVYIFSAMAFFILLIAGINFMNLSTARSRNRAKEVGMRKVSGAHRTDIIKQFLGESILLSFVALIFAIVLVELLLPAFNTLSGKQLTINIFGNIRIILGLIGIALFAGIVSGSYPALFLSSFQPVRILNGFLKSGSKSYRFRRTLVVFQFFLTITFIIGTIVIYSQLDYLRNRKLGFDKEHLVYIPISNDIRQKYNSFKNELLQNTSVLNITASSSLPSWGTDIGTEEVNWPGKNPDENFLIRGVGVDYEFIETFGIEIAEGRTFSEEFSTDTTNYILNEKAVSAMEMESHIGEQFTLMGNTGTIIGVVKNYHFKSLYNEIESLVLRLYAPRWLNFIFIRIKSDNISQTIHFLESKWRIFSPDFPFEYNFVDELLDNMYTSVQRMGKLFCYFTILAIFISCLGLFGLASFMAEQRTKEIGIRKVLGASISNIVLLLSKEFTRWVVVANFIAWPIAWYTMNKLLQNFAYRISIGFWTFLLAGTLAIVFALLTVSYQAIRAATANPVEALRYE